MPIDPYQNIDSRIEYQRQMEEPLLTYEFDFETGDFTGRKIDGKEALRQKIKKILLTRRFTYMIYSSAYGSEVQDLIAQELTPEFLNEEIPRLIVDALSYEPEIFSISELSVERDASGLWISLSIQSPFGELPMTWTEGGIPHV